MSDITLLGFDPAGIGKEREKMKTLKDMSGPDLKAAYYAYCMDGTHPVYSGLDIDAELLRRLELAKRAESAESERDQARAARDGTREDLARLQRTVDFTEAQYLKNHGGSWGECRFHAENKELAGKLSTARTALTMIWDWEDCDCDHTNESCCVQVGEPCSFCLAATTLAALTP